MSNAHFFSDSVMAGLLAKGVEGSISPLMATPTSTLSWSPMLVVRAMCSLFPSKAPKLDGSPCFVTGGKTGRATLTWVTRVCHSWLLLLMAEPPHLWMLPLPTGILVRLLKEYNSEDCQCLLVLQFWSFWYVKYLNWTHCTVSEQRIEVYMFWWGCLVSTVQYARLLKPCNSKVGTRSCVMCDGSCPSFPPAVCRMSCPMLAEEGWNHAHQWLW